MIRSLTAFPRILLWSLVAVTVALTLLLLFTYEYTVPREGAAGIAVSWLPRLQTVVLESWPDSLWFTVEDEWGGESVYVRRVLVHRLLPVTAVLTLLGALSDRPRRWIPAVTAGLWLISLAVVLLGATTRTFADYQRNQFAIKFGCCTPQSTQAVSDELISGESSLLISEGTLRVLTASYDGFYPMLLLWLALTAWWAYSVVRTSAVRHV